MLTTIVLPQDVQCYAMNFVDLITLAKWSLTNRTNHNIIIKLDCLWKKHCIALEEEVWYQVLPLCNMTINSPSCWQMRAVALLQAKQTFLQKAIHVRTFAAWEGLLEFHKNQFQKKDYNPSIGCLYISSTNPNTLFIQFYCSEDTLDLSSFEAVKEKFIAIENKTIVLGHDQADFSQNASKNKGHSNINGSYDAPSSKIAYSNINRLALSTFLRGFLKEINQSSGKSNPSGP